MMTLKEMVRDRKTVEVSPQATPEAVEVPARAIQIHMWSGEIWVLPWGYFYSAQLRRNADRDQLVLRIAHHEIVLEGTRLALLLPEIARFQVEYLRDLPGKFLADTDESVPFISRISVCPAMAESESGARTS